MKSVLLALLMHSAAAPSTTPPPFDQPTHVATLDAALARGDYNFISKAALETRSALEGRASLDWLGQQFNRGASPMIALTYSRALTSVAAAMPPESANQLRGTALAALLYASAVSAVEDRQCADRTAWGNRLVQMAPQIEQSGLSTLDEPTRRLAAAIALHVEKTTWERRKLADDAAFLCMNGMAAMTAGLRTGAVREVKPREGQIGKQMSVTVPDDFKYERRPDAEWWPEAETLRGQLLPLVLKLAKVDRLPTQAELQAMGGG